MTDIKTTNLHYWWSSWIKFRSTKEPQKCVNNNPISNTKMYVYFEISAIFAISGKMDFFFTFPWVIRYSMVIDDRLCIGFVIVNFLKDHLNCHPSSEKKKACRSQQMMI
jgi:hypothetical protein